MNQIESYLFQTKALKVCPENKPFWYTSGKIGPYFINTHFLYGSEADATEFLQYIDTIKTEKETVPQKIFAKVYHQYQNNTIYHDVINQMKEYIESHIDLTSICYISGGERRDWFFSNLLSYLLKKPHITIFKDASCFVSDYGFNKTEKISSLENEGVLHIADLITVASSYFRAWIPAIESKEGKMLYSTVVVDRMQGGEEKLKEKGVTSLTLIQINDKLFQDALENKIITKEQYEMIVNFLQNPDQAMRDFLVSHPEFLKTSLSSDEKTASRAKLCIDSDLYHLTK